jgi:hypothetical protein
MSVRDSNIKLRKSGFVVKGKSQGEQQLPSTCSPAAARPTTCSAATASATSLSQRASPRPTRTAALTTSSRRSVLGVQSGSPSSTRTTPHQHNLRGSGRRSSCVATSRCTAHVEVWRGCVKACFAGHDHRALEVSLEVYHEIHDRLVLVGRDRMADTEMLF